MQWWLGETVGAVLQPTCKEDGKVKWRGKRTRNSSKLQGRLMERNNMANYISEGYLFQNEFLMKK